MVEKVAIITDTDCDLSPEELAAINVQCVSLSITLEDGTIFPTENTPENIEAFFDHMATCHKLPKTSMPTPLDFEKLYAQLEREEYTHAVVVPITGAMSGTIQAARMACKATSMEVEVVETHRNTLSLAHIVQHLSKLRSEGVGFSGLVETARTIYDKVDIVFSIDNLKNLVKGGRTGKATGLAATLLNIKPILTVDNDGEVITLGKVRSMKRAINKLADNAEELVDRLGALEGYFVHVRNLPAAEQLRRVFQERAIPFRDMGTKQVGPIIATHVGLGTVGFTYIPQDL